MREEIFVGNGVLRSGERKIFLGKIKRVRGEIHELWEGVRRLQKQTSVRT